jgi:hypothetical protein
MQANRAFFIFYTIFTLFSITSVQPLLAQSLADIRVLKISPQDKAAVMELSDGQLQLIRIGDLVNGFGQVVEIAPQRIVFEKQFRGAKEILVIRLIGEQQKLERIRKSGNEKPVYAVPPDQTGADKSN